MPVLATWPSFSIGDLVEIDMPAAAKRAKFVGESFHRMRAYVSDVLGPDNYEVRFCVDQDRFIPGYKTEARRVNGFRGNDLTLVNPVFKEDHQGEPCNKHGLLICDECFDYLG